MVPRSVTVGSPVYGSAGADSVGESSSGAGVVDGDRCRGHPVDQPSDGRAERADHTAETADAGQHDGSRQQRERGGQQQASGDRESLSHRCRAGRRDASRRRRSRSCAGRRGTPGRRGTGTDVRGAGGGPRRHRADCRTLEAMARAVGGPARAEPTGRCRCVVIWRGRARPTFPRAPHEGSVQARDPKADRRPGWPARRAGRGRSPRAVPTRHDRRSATGRSPG